MCVAQMWDGHWTEDRLDRLVARLFRSEGVDIEPNLQSVKNGIKTSERRRQLLNLTAKCTKGNKWRTMNNH